MPSRSPLRRRWARLGLAPAGVALLLAVSGCPAPTAGPSEPTPTADLAYACPSGDLLVEGNDTDRALLESHVENYSTACRNAGRILVGTARDAGTTSFVNGLVHIAASDTPLDAAQRDQAAVRCLRNPAWHLPVSVDPVALVHRVDTVPDLTLRPVTLAKIFSGVITHWNDPDIAADNPGATLPAERIAVIPRSGRTGITESLSGWLSRQAPEQWPVGTTQAWRGQGEARASAQEVLDAVRTTPYSLAYLEYSQLPRTVLSPTPTPTPGATAEPTATAGRTPSATPRATAAPTGTPQLLRLAGPNGPIELTPKSATAAVDHLQPLGTGPDLVIDPASVDAPGGWPIHRISYQVLCSAGVPPEATALEKDWLTYLLDEPTQAALADEGRVPLPASLRDRVRASVAEIR